jgi:hypothetical protein
MTDSTRPAPDEIEPGIPATSEMPATVPPGSEDEEEPPPRDYPQGVEEWGTTAREEALGESVALRAAREEPDFGERAAPAEGGISVYEPGADSGIDDEADAIGELDTAAVSDLAPEEMAMRIDDEPAGLNYDPDPGYLTPE